MSDWSGQRRFFAPSMVALASTVPTCMLQPPISPPVQAQSSWLRVCWGSPLLPHLMSAPVAALAVAAAKVQNGPTWIMLMFPYVNVTFHMLLMRLSTSAFSQLPLPPPPPCQSSSALFWAALRWGLAQCGAFHPLGLHLTNCEFCCCLHYWLGVPLHSVSYPKQVQRGNWAPGQEPPL